MNTGTQIRCSRFAAFKRVLVEATKPASPSPAFAKYRAAITNTERGAAFESLTKTDRELIVADAIKSHEAWVKGFVEEQRADDAAFKASIDARNAAIKLAKDARIAILPPVARRRAERRRLITKIFYVTGTCLFVVFVTAQLVGEVSYFGWSLFHDWIIWAFLIGANIAIFVVCIVVAYWRVIISVVKSLPSAIYAAIATEPE